MSGVYTVFVENLQGERIGVLDDWEKLEVIKRYNNVGKIILTMGIGNLDMVDWFGSPYRLAIWRNGKALSSGLVQSVYYSPTNMRLICDDEVGMLNWRLGLPVPDGPPYESAEYAIYSGPAESVMKNLLLDNLNHEREIDGLNIAADQGRGDEIEIKARFDVVLDLMQTCAQKGGLQFDVVDGVFDVQVPADLEKQVTFSFQNGNLLDFDLTQRAPNGTYGYLLGTGEGTERYVFEGGDAAAMQRWGRREFVKDMRRLDEESAFAQELSNQLANEGARLTLNASCVDSNVARFGEDYWVGSKVKVYVPRLFAVEKRVMEVRFQYDAENGDMVQSSISDESVNIGSSGFSIFFMQKKLAERISQLEKI